MKDFRYNLVNDLFLMNKKAFRKCLKFFTHSFILIYLTLGGIQHLRAQDDNIKAGKKLFNANCAACHKLNKRAVGPALKGVSSKYDKEWLYSWIKNSTAMVKSGDAQAVAIYEEYNKSVMTSFPQLSNEDIDNIIAYTDFTPPAPVAAVGAPSAQTVNSSVGVSNTIILLALALVFIILVIMLFLVQRTLLRIAKLSGVEIKVEKKSKRTPIWMAFIQNQFLVMMSVILLLLSSAYFVYGYFMQVGVDQGYMPVQPIHYSHKIHAGQIKLSVNIVIPQQEYLNILVFPRLTFV